MSNTDEPTVVTGTGGMGTIDGAAVTEPVTATDATTRGSDAGDSVGNVRWTAPTEPAARRQAPAPTPAPPHRAPAPGPDPDRDPHWWDGDDSTATTEPMRPPRSRGRLDVRKLRQRAHDRSGPAPVARGATTDD